jgi:branched-chain amino acid transport system permease protein
MTFFLQQIITGISIGGIYALLAVGYALIYSVFDFSNFAFGCVMMASAFTCYYSILLLNMGLIPAVLLSVVVGIILSLLIEFLAYRPLRKKGTNRLFLMITGMGVDLAITNTATVLLGANARSIEVKSINMEAFRIGDLYLSKLDVGALVIALISFTILYIYIYRTKAGIGIRASAYSTSIAGMMGINVNRISIIIFVISGITAGVAGVFCGMKYAVLPTVGSTPALKAFIASVLGGLGSLSGAVVGGLVLGILETFVSGFVSSVYRDLVSYGVLILVLLFVPGGLMGRSNSDKI